MENHLKKVGTCEQENELNEDKVYISKVTINYIEFVCDDDGMTSI